MRHVLFALLAAAVCHGPARADTLPLLVGVPAEYIPGTPFTFEVRAPGVADLGAYNVELVLQAAGQLGVAAAPPGVPAMYPFGTTANLVIGGPFASGGETRLTLSDFLLNGPGVATVAGQNDLLATVTVSPAATLTGLIRIAIAADSRQFDTFDGSPIPSDAPAAVVVGQAGAG